MDYDKTIKMLVRAIVNGQATWGSAVAQTELRKIISHNPEIVIQEIFSNPNEFTKDALVKALSRIYDIRIEALMMDWARSGDDFKQTRALFYLANVDSKFAEEVIYQFQDDKRSHMRDRAGVALAELIQVRLAKENKELED